MCTITSIDEICKSYSDQTGKFPTNAYIQLAQILKRATKKSGRVESPRVAPTTTPIPIAPPDPAPTPRVVSESDTATFTTMPGPSPGVKQKLATSDKQTTVFMSPLSK